LFIQKTVSLILNIQDRLAAAYIYFLASSFKHLTELFQPLSASVSLCQTSMPLAEKCVTIGKITVDYGVITAFIE
jgi:hypothetical protein